MVREKKTYVPHVPHVNAMSMGEDLLGDDVTVQMRTEIIQHDCANRKTEAGKL